jgi:hypothetical protein
MPLGSISSEIPKMDQRIVKRNGVTYEQNTGNIGNTQRARPADEPRSATTSILQQPRPALSHCYQDTFQPLDVDEQPWHQPAPPRIRMSSLRRRKNCGCERQPALVFELFSRVADRGPISAHSSTEFVSFADNRLA